MERKKQTAFHEAGHSVVALLMGRSVQKVSILSSQNRLGVCTIQKGRSRQVKDKLAAEMLILLAGMVAESRISGRYNLEGASQDLRVVERLALLRAGSTGKASKLIKRMLEKTHYLLSQEANWEAVKSISLELLKNESLSGGAAVHLLKESQRIAQS